MKEEDPSGSGPHRPSMEAQNRSCDGIGAAAELPSVKMDDSQFVGAPVMAASVSAAVEVEVKRKRGRPPKGQAKPPPSKMKKEDEDVCFICFDGGSLVLCDRRACPKAYHPACIKRDEAFFRSRAKWNCGWHICSRCQKAAHYMCYTCTYSLCKACTKDADYVCVRENKGFCTTCMRTIMLIENNDQGNKAEVDFDDKSSWEYLFKIYWICLKENLSLTLDELYRAQNPWKAAGTVARKGQSLYLHYGGNDSKGSISEIPRGHLEANNSKRTKGQPNLPNKGDSLGMDKSISDNGNTSGGSVEWASKELLEFVAHMRNGDTSVLSQSDVQALLVDYIKTNNLRDPHSRNQIICDLRLRNLFGRPRVGHFEMLTLLEFHFLTKEDSPKAVIQRDIVDAVVSQVEGDGSNDNLLMMPQDQNGKTCRKDEERGPQANLNEYAAIDFHNINLIFLRRKLMESLIVDYGKFHDKAVGSIVRIQIYTGDQKQDMHRLVQVVGTCKVAMPYKIGERTIDVILEILNLDKKETISIDAISDQEFSEDECLRLRRSIKCGLVKPLTVGQVQEKAIALQEVRLDDWLESELMRLNHLRDRASERGHKNELRECVEKLELLKTPEERQRRLREIPDIHVDPKMDPNCESDEEDGVNSSKKQDEYAKPSYSEFSRDARESTSTQNGDISNDSDNMVLKNLTTCDQSKSTSSPFYLDKGVPSRVVDRANESSWNDGIDACGSNVLEKPGNQVDSSGSVVGGWNNQAGLFGSFSGVGSETSVASLSSGSVPPADDNETDKLYLWHYRDPNGNIQGPFCMLQLRKWSTTGYFPPDMRIWGINDEEGDSLLLTDVLDGQLCKASTLQYNISISSQPHETSLHQARGHDSQRWDSTSNHGNWSSPGNVRSHNIGGQSTDNRTNSQGYLAQSSGESWKPLSVNYSSTNWDSNSGFASVAKSTDASEQNFGIDLSKLPRPMPETSNVDLECQTTKDQQSVPSNFPVKKLDIIQNLPSSLPKPSDGDDKADPGIQKMPSSQPKPTDEDEKIQATENKQSVSSNFLVQNSGPSRSRASSLVVGGEKRLPEIAGQWGGFSPLEPEPSNPMITLLQALAAQSTQEFSTRAKPSVEEWDSGLVCVSSLKPPEVVSDHTATPTSQCDELSPPSSSHLASKASSWQAMVTEPIEFSTLAEESVSDLLAEVDAMAQCELPSPTWVTRCVEELFEDSKTDCFTSLGGLSPPMDSGKNDVLSSTGDTRLPPQPTMTDQSLGASQVDVINPVKKSGGKSSRNAEVELKTKPANIPVNHSEANSNSQHPVASTTGQDMIDRDPARRSGATSQKTARGNANTNRTTSVGVTGRESHSRHGGERHASPRDRSLHSGDSGISRGRPSWSRQSFGGGGGGGGGGYSRLPPPKGKRVCKFYESGHCRKGSYCDYLHP